MNNFDLNIERLIKTFEKINFWFVKSGNGFYKFLQPCQHPHYRSGDSWCEELGVSEKTFRKYFSQICEQHPNKKSFYLSKDPFNSKPFASFHDRITKKTYYFGSIPNIKDFCKKICFYKETKNFTPQFRLDSESNIHKSKDIYIPPKSPKKPSKREGELFLKKEEMQKAQILVDIWKKETKNLIAVPKISQNFAKKILDFLKNKMKNSIENWKRYCKSIGSSKFLMGEISNFKAWLIWILKDEVLQSVQKGLYGIQIRFSFDEKEREDEIKEIVNEEIKKTKCEKVRKAKEGIIFKLGFKVFYSWFIKNISFFYRDGSVFIETLDRFTHDWIKQRYANSLTGINISMGSI